MYHFVILSHTRCPFMKIRRDGCLRKAATKTGSCHIVQISQLEHFTTKQTFQSDVDIAQISLQLQQLCGILSSFLI